MTLPSLRRMVSASSGVEIETSSKVESRSLNVFFIILLLWGQSVDGLARLGCFCKRERAGSCPGFGCANHAKRLRADGRSRGLIVGAALRGRPCVETQGGNL